MFLAFGGPIERSIFGLDQIMTMKRNLLYAITILVLAAMTTGAVAQQTYYFGCGTDKMYRKAKAANPRIAQYEQEQEQFISEFIRNNNLRGEEDTIIIPIVFHVLHQGGPENISDAQILDQMRILNEDFNKRNSDTTIVIPGFRELIADVHIEFRLARLDPYGNCTNGIDRIFTSKTNAASDASKITPWLRDRYLNVWVVNSIGEEGVAGYAYYPSSVIDFPMSSADGIIILHDYIGSIGSGSDFRSRALTHEIGHWLNLAHPWGNTNDPQVECGDDFVPDTPPTKGFNNCNDLYVFECNALDLDTNYMYKFNNVTTTSGTIDPTPGAEIEEGRLTLSSFRANGVGANPSSSESFAFSGWPTGAADGVTLFADLTGTLQSQKYYEFTVTPDMYSAMTLSAITFEVSRNETGPRTFAVRSSVDNYSLNLGGAMQPSNVNMIVQGGNIFFIRNDVTNVIKGGRVNLTAAGFSTANGPITFRIYAYNAEDATGVFSIDNVTLLGTYGQIENVQNYMDYSYCSHMFTTGQKDRMLGALASSASSRNFIYSPTALEFTGVLNDPPVTCAPKSNFFVNERFVCIGDNVQFTANPSNATPTSYMWSFQDGSPSTSASTSPSVSFSSPGWKTVTLTVMNDQGSDSKTVQRSVFVSPGWSDEASGLWQEDFSVAPNLTDFWLVNNTNDNNTFWKYTNTAGYSGNTSVMMNAVEIDPVNVFDDGAGDIDELITPSLDLSFLNNGATFTFKYAYASRGQAVSDITETLEVFSSRDCGETWSSRLSLSGLELAAAGNAADFFVPTPANFTTASFAIPSTITEAGVRFKFVFTSSGFSNNIYIDDININGTVSVDELAVNDYSMSIYPNPANANSVLSVSTKSEEVLNIRIVDITGKEIAVINQKALRPGTYQFPIGQYNLASGLYFITAQSSARKETIKFIVEK